MITKASQTSPIIASGYNVNCDLCDNVCYTQEDTKREARFQAKGWGWTRSKAGGVTLDACDVCREVAKERAEAGLRCDYTPKNMPDLMTHLDACPSCRALVTA